MGPRSSGKSTLLRHFAASIERSVVLELGGPLTHSDSVLVRLLQSAELSPGQLSDVEQRKLLSVFIQERRSQGLGVVLAVDAAEGLGEEAWQEIARLREVCYESGPALKLLLVIDSDGRRNGAPATLLSDERVTEIDVRPASASEVAEYLAWRLGSADLGELFTPTATKIVARTTQGRFAAIDLLCQMSLLMLRETSEERVDVRLVHRAALALAKRHHQQAAAPVNGARAAAEDAADGPDRIIVSRDGEMIVTAELGPRTLIGRSEHNDLILSSPYLSRHHAVIVGTSDGYYIADLNSANGLSLNGKLIRRAILRHGDLLTLGPYRLKLSIRAAANDRNPLPTASSLEDTLVMPPRPSSHPPVRLVT